MATGQGLQPAALRIRAAAHSNKLRCGVLDGISKCDGMDDNLRFRYWQSLFSLPAVWLPAASGICLTLSGYTSSFIPIGLGISAAVLVFLVATRGKKYEEQVQENVRQERRYLRQAKLRDLRRRLRQDKDHRSSQCVRDLQDLYDRIFFHRLLEDDEQSGTAADVLAEVRGQTWQLLEAGEEALERTYELWRAANDMSSDSGREAILRKREELLEEVNESLMNLGEALDFLQTGRLRETDTERSVANAGEQLERGLEVARKIHERLDDLEEETRIAE